MMLRFLLRIFALISVIALFIYLSYNMVDLCQANPFLARHHSINLAYLGTFLSIASLGYMLRKYNYVKGGKIRRWLDAHVAAGTLGLLLVLVHSRYQFHALVPGLNTVFMILVGVTGLFGWHLYLTTVKSLLAEIKSMEDAEEYVMAKMASSAFRFWRFVHILSSLGALFFTIIHGLSLIIFRGQY